MPPSSLSGIHDGGRTGTSFTTEQSFKGVAVQASSSEDVYSIAVAGAAGFYAGIAGGVTVEVMDSDTAAFIGHDAKVNQTAGAGALQWFNVSRPTASRPSRRRCRGRRDRRHRGRRRRGHATQRISAHIDSGALVNARHDIDVNALGDKDITTLALSAAGGLVGISGSVSVWSIGTPVSGSYSVDGDTDDPLKDEDDASKPTVMLVRRQPELGLGLEHTASPASSRATRTSGRAAATCPTTRS